MTQLELFEEHLPERPWCTDDYRGGLRVLPKEAALRKREVQPHSPWERWHLIFDVDRDGAWAAAEEAGLPAPTWVAINPKTGHGHVAYSLRDPVLIGPGNRAKPQKYAVQVERAIRVKLQADRSYSGFLTHNPLHRHWAVIVNGYVFELAELHEAAGDLRQYQEPPREEGIGRNVEAFNDVRIRAYRMVREFWRPEGREAFIEWCGRAVVEFSESHHAPPLDRRECRQIGRSIGRWVWDRFSPGGFSAEQSRRGRGGERVQGRRATRNAEIRRLHRAGMRNREIARLIGCSHQTVGRALGGPKPYQV